MPITEKDFANISREIMKKYHEEIHRYLTTNPDGSITDADVVILIMNLTIGVATNIYYSLKQILPTTQLDFDYMKAKMMNSMVDAFEEIKKYNPKENQMPLSVEQIKEISEKGSTTITFADGTKRVVTEADVLVKKADAARIAENTVKNVVRDESAPKIILPT